MSEIAKKKTSARGLGKGVNILIPEMAESANDNAFEEGVRTLNINEIEPNREQPRKIFDESALSELADSISAFGIIQPVVVRKTNGYYEIVAGERRWRAARMAGLSEIPVIIKDYNEQNALKASLIENLQRENLTPVEEALTYKRLQDEYGLTQDAVAEAVGKKRSTVANSLRILNLPDKVLNMIDEGKISLGHAKALLYSDDEEIQSSVADKIIEADLNVRQTEELMRSISAKHDKESSSDKKHPFSLMYKGIERELSGLFGTKVKLHFGKNKSNIQIEYFSDDDLDRLIQLFKKLGD